MRYVLRLGEVSVGFGDLTTYVLIDELGQVAPVRALNDENALREIIDRAGADDVVCAPVLAHAAGKLGLRCAPSPPWALIPFAELATVTHLGDRGIEPAARAAIGPALTSACQLVTARPWSWLRNADAIDFDVVRMGEAPRILEGCVMGAGGQEYGVALYDQPGSLARLARAGSQGRPADVRKIDSHGFTIDAGPRWVAEAVEAAYGVALAIFPIRVRAGAMRPVSAQDLWLMACAAAAAARLTEAHGVGVATIGRDQECVTVTAKVRTGQPLLVSRTPARSPAAERAASTNATGSASVEARPAGRELRPDEDNPYCRALGIAVPRLEDVIDHREAIPFALLLVALLERGGPMTLPEVAARLDAAGGAPVADELRSLKRCRPARAPVYRDGEHYALDPHDAELDLWAFRLGLRPARVSQRPVESPALAIRPAPDQPLTVAELDEAWTDASLSSWSRASLALAVLDAHGCPLAPDAVVAFVTARTKWHSLRSDASIFRRGAPLTTRADGAWEIVPGSLELARTRDAVRDAAAKGRLRAAMQQDPVTIEANVRASEERRAAHAAELATLRRVIVHAFPVKAPDAVVLLDIGGRTLETFLGAGELAAARQRIATYDLIGAVDVRAVLRELGVDPGERRLAELGPPQKSMRLNQAGRTLKITTAMLVQGSCGISRPFGDAAKLLDYLHRGQYAQLRRRLEADAKSLFALYEYGRLHGCVRLRWGFLDEMLRAPWVHRDEPVLRNFLQRAHSLGVAVDAVVGSAPGWDDPWSRARRFRVEQGASVYELVMVGEDSYVVPAHEVQRVRLAATIH